MTGRDDGRPRVGLLTREWPPGVYGGAGVHVVELARALRALIEVEVHCFGAPRDDAQASEPDPALAEANAALAALSVDLRMAAAVGGCDVLHSHTWYANLAGHVGGLLHGLPHVVTTHSLEPHRPWKAEQLGGGYRLSSWAESTALHAADAVIAVSAGMRRDVLRTYPALDPQRVHVVTNGIDSERFAPAPPERVRETTARYGVDPARPSVLFVGRITRQKGLVHLLRAAADLPAEAQLVLAAGAPDTPALAAETAALVADLAAHRSGVLWLREMLPVDDVVALLTAATVFVCPSVYEPLGIVNLEAMACGTAVVASDVGGIPEVVQDGVTGLLVHHDPDDPAVLERGLSGALGALLADPARAAAMGAAGRRRAVGSFGWAGVAEQTLQVYRLAQQRRRAA